MDKEEIFKKIELIQKQVADMLTQEQIQQIEDKAFVVEQFIYNGVLNPLLEKYYPEVFKILCNIFPFYYRKILK